MVGKDLSLIIDHDEKTCREEYDNECYYTIIILGQGLELETTKYSINVMNNQ